jgi:hypothetical protein
LAGIFDSKSRIMDTLITVTGRDQAARGELDVQFASITDRQVYYSTGSDGVLHELSNRIYFEAASDDNDTIVYELDAKGSMQPFVSDDYVIYGGAAYDLTQSQSTTMVGGAYGGTLNTPGSIELVTDTIIDSSTNNFKRQMIIGSRVLAKFDKNEPFTIDKNEISFEITNDSPIPVDSASAILTVDQTESVFQDHKFGNLLNYRFLPPITKPYTGALTGSVMAEYSNINQNPLDTYEELEEYLEGKKYEEVKFSKTSLSNNILGQLFSVDVSTNTLSKLAIIDVGEFQVDGAFNPHLFFAGKLYRDSVGALTFVNIFTIVLE